MAAREKISILRRMKISVIVVAYNEAHNIRRCLESVKDIADEMIVVDSGSQDDTVAICKEIGAKVIDQPFLGYIEQKNFAIAQAGNEWLLSLDADEELSPELKTSILAAMQHPEADGYSMNRLTQYCGTWVRHSGWYPDVKLRLFKKHVGQFAGMNPHDEYKFHDEGTLIHLKGDLLHYSYVDLTDFIEKMDHFSMHSADAMFKHGRRSSLLKIIYKPIARFFRHYLVKAGFLDGTTGFIIAINSAYGVFLKYLRLYYLHKGTPL